MALIYCELTDGTDKVPNNLLAGMLRLRHVCNPDFQQQYPSVVRWYVEIDLSTVRVLREIGLDSSGHPIVYGPVGRNDGLWTGIAGVDGRRSQRVEKATFEAAWRSLENAYRDTVPPKRIEPRVPIRDRDQLVGRWSAAILEGPCGGMSDQLISFLPDSNGFFEDYNVDLMYYDEFQWEIVGNGRITIRGLTCYHRDDASQVVETPSDFHYDSIAAETQVHHSGSGASTEVLYLPLRNEQRAWVGNVYGRCDLPLSELATPRFQ